MATINKENLIQLWKKIKSYVEEKLEDYPSTEQLPQAIEEALAGKNLPNPNSLVFTGAVSAEYDGSAPVTVEIPEGGGGTSGGGSEKEWFRVGEISFTEELLGTPLFEYDLPRECEELFVYAHNLVSNQAMGWNLMINNVRCSPNNEVLTSDGIKHDRLYAKQVGNVWLTNRCSFNYDGNKYENDTVQAGALPENIGKATKVSIWQSSVTDYQMYSGTIAIYAR